MKKYLIPLAVLATVGAAGAAMAEQSSGALVSMNGNTATVKLSDGQTYAYSPDDSIVTDVLGNLRIGDHVTVHWAQFGKERQIESVMINNA